jgi:hypothetical protein
MTAAARDTMQSDEVFVAFSVYRQMSLERRDERST